MQEPAIAASMSESTGHSSLAAFKELQKIHAASRYSTAHQRLRPSLPPLSLQRQTESLHEKPYDLTTTTIHHTSSKAFNDPQEKTPNTILYLAYGSNLAASTFLDRRGIRPLSQVNVVVPELVMTFDLAGVPYVEPCFANTAYRSSSSYPPAFTPPEPTTDAEQNTQLPDLSDEKNPHPPISEENQDYHKLHWPKGLIGCVYEVTPPDYAHIIATEGGGASYQDVLVTCHSLPQGTHTVPTHPTTPPFKAHTLYSPVFSPNTPGKSPPPGKGGRTSRPDPNYAQPSSRYLSLITDGASEHDFPEEYMRYLRQLRPYRITTRSQEMGQWIFMMIWIPFIRLVFGLQARYADEEGRAPGWLVGFMKAVFAGMWGFYDGWFRGVFGDGERTVGEGGGEGCGEGDGEWEGDGVLGEKGSVVWDDDLMREKQARVCEMV